MLRENTFLNWFWFLGGLLILGIMALVSPWDLEVSTRLADHGHPFGRWIQNYGTMPELPIYLLGIAWLSISSLRQYSSFISRCLSAILVQAILHAFLVTTGLKHLWGRIRFVDLAANMQDFTSIFTLTPLSGGVSFPSGHVASSLICLPAVYLAYSLQRHLLANLVLALVLSWGLIVAYARILFGAHYLTDVLFSFGMAFLLAPLSLKLGDAYLRRFDSK